MALKDQCEFLVCYKNWGFVFSFLMASDPHHPRHFGGTDSILNKLDLVTQVGGYSRKFRSEWAIKMTFSAASDLNPFTFTLRNTDVSTYITIGASMHASTAMLIRGYMAEIHRHRTDQASPVAVTNTPSASFNSLPKEIIYHIVTKVLLLHMPNGIVEQRSAAAVLEAPLLPIFQVSGTLRVIAQEILLQVIDAALQRIGIRLTPIRTSLSWSEASRTRVV